MNSDSENIFSVSPVYLESFDDGVEVTILSDTQRDIISTVNFACLNAVITMFGVVANCFNIIIFIRQGFSNTVNMCFLGIALSDLSCLLTMAWVGVLLNPLVAASNVPWVTSEFAYMTGGWPHIVFARITSYITVYVTAERWLCTVAPLKIKQIVTPARTAIAVSLIYILNILSLFPEYATSYLDWKFFPHTNKTLLAVIFTSERDSLAGATYMLNSFAGMLSFVTVIIFTSLLVVKLKKSSKWRKKATSGSDQSRPMSSRDKKTVKMIVLIATVLIVCYTPGTILTLATFIQPEFVVGKKHTNMAVAMWSLAFVFEAVNSSVNIFVYHTMSSKYRQTFSELFNECGKRSSTNVNSRSDEARTL